MLNSLKVNKFINSMWQLIISTSNDTLEVLWLRPWLSQILPTPQKFCGWHFKQTVTCMPMTPLWKPCLHTVMTDKNLFDLTLV